MTTFPSVSQPFEWRVEPWGPALVCSPLAEIARHLYTTRHLELSGLSGWMALASSLGVTAGNVLRLRQTHGSDIVVVRRGHRSASWEAPEGDGLLSNDPQVALVVRVADCVPMLMADRVSGAVGAVHAGWRGTAAGIATKAVAAMSDAFGTDPANLVVSLGPAINSCCYEVGPELVDAFAAHGHERHLIDRWFLALPPRRGERDRPPLRLDLLGANRDQVVLAGVPEASVYSSALCTAENLTLLTSFRAERERAGRLAGAIRAGQPH